MPNERENADASLDALLEEHEITEEGTQRGGAPTSPEAEPEAAADTKAKASSLTADERRALKRVRWSDAEIDDMDIEMAKEKASLLIEDQAKVDKTYEDVSGLRKQLEQLQNSVNFQTDADAPHQPGDQPSVQKDLDALKEQFAEIVGDDELADALTGKIGDLEKRLTSLMSRHEKLIAESGARVGAIENDAARKALEASYEMLTDDDNFGQVLEAMKKLPSDDYSSRVEHMEAATRYTFMDELIERGTKTRAQRARDAGTPSASGRGGKRTSSGPSRDQLIDRSLDQMMDGNMEGMRKTLRSANK